MKEIAMKGRKAGKTCGRIWIAAFTLAVLASCQNETADESVQEAQQTAPQQINENNRGSQTADLTAAGTAPQRQAKPFVVPEQDQYSVKAAEKGFIMLSGGEIVSPAYLSECTEKGLEPIGIICYREEDKKFLIGIDAFYEPESLYGWGTPKTENERLQAVQVVFAREAWDLTKFALKRSGTKQYSDGNNASLSGMITRGTEQHNVYLDYIASYGRTHQYAVQGLNWEAPTVYESYSICTYKANVMEGINAVIRYFTNVHDSRGRLLESSGGLMYEKKYVLTSSSNEQFTGKADCTGIWAFKELNPGDSTPSGNTCYTLPDINQKEIKSYQFLIQDQSSNDKYQIEYILVKPNTDGFAAMAVAALY